MTNAVRHRYYSDIRGIDLSSAPAEVSRGHFCDLRNMWHDPVCADSLLTESFPGYRVFARFPSPIYGIYTQRLREHRYLVVHAADKLYRFDSELCNHPKDMAALMPICEGLPKEKGCGFLSGSSLYLLIGGKYYRLSAEGELYSAEDESVYLPTTFYNGEPYEQRNLLTNRVQHKFTADGDFLVTEQEENLLYRIADAEAHICFVTGTKKRDAVSITIPASTLIDGEEYTVMGISPSAFAGMTTLVQVRMSGVLQAIAANAFAGCTALLSVILPDSLRQIGEKAFYGCLSLREVHFGTAFCDYAADPFLLCPALSEASFAMSQEEYEAMVERLGSLLPSQATQHFNAEPPKEHAACLVRYPILDPAVSILAVYLNDTRLDTNFIPLEEGFLLYRPVREGELITHMELLVSDAHLLNDGVVRCELLLSPSRFYSVRPYPAFGEGFPDMTGSEAVKGCRMAAFYDGRFFLTGNPDLPNTVFHTLPDITGRNNPFYIGVLSYFNDGDSAVPNRAIFSASDALIVCKEDENGTGAIYYHTPAATGEDFIPRIYPVEATSEGMGAVGDAVCFKDDPVFLGREGLIGIGKRGFDAERSLSVRSHRINARLLRESLSTASLAVHEGILYLLSEGNIYLADQRLNSYHKGGEVGYEWYFLSSIGSYTGDHPLYRTCSFLPPGAEKAGITLASEADIPVQGEVYSVRGEDGMLYYEKRTDGTRVAVDTDGERTGGSFSPATLLASDGKRLFFGTADGSVGVFNTDKRGKRLYRLVRTTLYARKNGVYLSPEEAICSHVSEECIERLPLYRKEGESYVPMGEGEVFLDGGRFSIAEPLGELVRTGEIHRFFYTFASHAYLAACTLAPDEGGLPHYTKDTVPRTAAVKVKTPRGGGFSVLVRTDRTPWRVCDTLAAGCADFGDFDFSLLDLHAEDAATIPLREKEKRWCFKQYRLASDGIRRPFGLYALAYSYRASGILKD